MADGLSVHVESKEVQRMLNGLLNRVQRPRPLMRQLERYVNAVTMKMFTGPRADRNVVRGVRWPELKDSTWRGKRTAMRSSGMTTDRPLVRTGRMRDSLKVLQRSDKGFIYGTRIRGAKGYPYPQVHNVGGGDVPARPWLFLTRDDFRNITTMTVAYLKGKLLLISGK